MPVFLSVCALLTFGGAAWFSFEAWRQLVVVLADKKAPTKHIVQEALAILMFFVICAAAVISALHSFASVWIR